MPRSVKNATTRSLATKIDPLQAQGVVLSNFCGLLEPRHRHRSRCDVHKKYITDSNAYEICNTDL